MNYSAETSLITALFFDDPTNGSGVDEAALLLESEDFSDEGCRLTFRALIKLRAAGLPVDLCHAVDALLEDGVPADRAYALLSDSSNGAPLPNCIPQYAKKIRDAARSRKLKRTISLANERLIEGSDVLSVKSDLVTEMEQIEGLHESNEDQRIGELANPVLNAIADRISGDESKRGLRTGIVALDSLTTGINPGELWICGAMPGRGKSAFALQVALNLSGEGIPVYMLSMEMSKAQIFTRLMKMKFGSHIIEDPGEHWGMVTQYAADLETLPFYVNQASSLEASDIMAKARLKIAKSGIRLVIVDYLQLIRGPGRDRREKIGDAADMLRRLAKDTGVPVLALSQLRRPDSLNDRPSMIELKESGDIEAHAHVILLLHMPINDDGSAMGEEEIIIGKQREGPTGSIPVYFDRPKAKFFPREKYPR